MADELVTPVRDMYGNPLKRGDIVLFTAPRKMGHGRQIDEIRRGEITNIAWRKDGARLIIHTDEFGYVRKPELCRKVS